MYQIPEELRMSVPVPSVRVGSAAAKLLTISVALEQALQMGSVELCAMLAEEKTRAVDEWIRERRAANPACFDLPSPLQCAVLDAV